MRWEEHVSRLGEVRNSYSTVLRKFEVKKSLGRAKRRQEDDTKLTLNKYHRSLRARFIKLGLGTSGSISSSRE
jgi:hypothetical protein